METKIWKNTWDLRDDGWGEASAYGKGFHCSLHGDIGHGWRCYSHLLSLYEVRQFFVLLMRVHDSRRSCRV